VLTVGAGFSSILAAYQIQKHTENVEHVIYEKNADLGGTWLENRYPGTHLFNHPIFISCADC
jgi:cation diffusion facilitator CzcD-associated flavoprotein CzcO